jgi:phosphoglycerate dehydrogenase-like enzyme
MAEPRVYIHRVLWCPYDRYMDEENEEALESFADVVNHGEMAEPLPSEELAKALKGCNGILSLNGSCAGEITVDVLQEAGTVEVASISHYWEQYHSVVPGWEEAGVEVLDASDPCSEAVAEWTLGAMIAGLRKFDVFDRRMKGGENWPDYGAAGQLNGSTVGLIGVGRVGRIVAEYLEPFDVEVLAYDPYMDEDEAEDLQIELVELDTVLTESDVVSLHARVTQETKGMIGARELALMQDGSLFVNSARMALVDADALREELAKKRFRAYLDVFEPEPPPDDDILRTLDNVVMTPHVAGTTPLMFLRCGAAAIEALREYFSVREAFGIRK